MEPTPPPTLNMLMAPAPKRRRLWPFLAAAAVVAVLAAAAVAAFALRNRTAPAAAPVTESAAADVRVGQPCSPPNATSKSLGGDRVQCTGGTWRSLEPPAPPPPPPADDLTAPVGHTFTVSGDDGLEADYQLTKTRTRDRDDFGDRAKRGVFLVVHVKVVVKSGSEYACSCNFQFVTSTGKVYQPAFNTFDGMDEFDALDLGKGQNYDGWIAFDVSRSQLKTGKIGFKPDSGGGDVAYWAL